MKFELTPSVFGYAESTSPEVEAMRFAEIPWAPIEGELSAEPTEGFDKV